MKPEFILLVIIGGFFCALIFFLIVFYKPSLNGRVNQGLIQLSRGVSTDADTINDLKSQIKSLEVNNNKLIKKQNEQNIAIESFQKFVSTQSAESTAQITNKLILAEAHTQGSGFTTTSTAYTPMGMYVNIRCPKNCLLWINFFTSAKNQGPVTSAQGNYNTYGLFLDNADQGFYSEANYAVDNAATPVSLNTVVSVGAGLHTVDIRAKTTGGTLRSNSSALQVIALEK